MKISIITVCYNAESTIEATILSVGSQVYENIELIIIDGLSVDSTMEIVKKYPDIVTKYISESDMGLYDAMNKGINLATGDYIGILNSDDVFYSSYTISDIVDFLSDNPIDACIGDIIQHSNGREIRRYTSRRWNPEKLKIGSMPPHPSIFIKSSLFKKLGNYRLDYKIASDYEMIIRFFLKNSISWKYSGIVTTLMKIGGISSSGYKSYGIITKEISKAFNDNKIKYSSFKVRFRFIWKIFDFLRLY